MNGILHRDFKSANVMITQEGRAKVLDFGVAERAVAPDGMTTGTETLAGVSGATAGTLSYTAPERLQARPASVRSDIWGLGVVLHEMIRGDLPFRGNTASELAAAILRDPPASIGSDTPAASPTPS